MPFELKSESAGPTSTNSPREDASFCETIVQKRASDSTEYSEKTAYIQKEKNFETDVSPSYRKQELDCDGDLIVSRRKPPCSSNVCCQRMAEYQSNSLMLCQCLNEEKSNPCQGVITIGKSIYCLNFYLIASNSFHFFESLKAMLLMCFVANRGNCYISVV